MAEEKCVPTMKPGRGLAATSNELALMEARFIQNQGAWLYAFAKGIQDHAPSAAEALLHQSTILIEEAFAAERAAEILAKEKL